jgi:hypothetical protein
MATVLSTKENNLRGPSLEGEHFGSGLNKHGEAFHEQDRESKNKRAGVDGMTGAAITEKAAGERRKAREKAKLKKTK